jgi:hypothetical protein
MFTDSGLGLSLISSWYNFQGNIDLFANISSEARPISSISGNKIDNSFDPFVVILSNNSGTRIDNRSGQTAETELAFGSFTSSAEQCHKPKTKDGVLQVKSGIWADSLSRGLIDLDITARKFRTSGQTVELLLLLILL